MQFDGKYCYEFILAYILFYIVYFRTGPCIAARYFTISLWFDHNWQNQNNMFLT